MSASKISHILGHGGRSGRGRTATGRGAANITGGIDSDCGALLGRDFVDDGGLE